MKWTAYCVLLGALSWTIVRADGPTAPNGRHYLSQPLVTSIYTADPSAHVFNGKIYVYPSHDVPTDIPDDDLGSEYAMHDYRVLKMDRKPLLGGDHDRRFFEASWMFQRNGLYYFTYSTGDTHFLAYATGRTPKGPFQYKGHFLLPVQGWTTHHSIMEWGGKWWLFYADTQLSKKNHLRNVKVTELHFDADGSIRTVDPFTS